MSTSTTSPPASALPDLQHTVDERGVALDRVGVCDLRYPITVLDRAQETQQVAATFSLAVDLPAEVKGTHMSRFIEILDEHRGEITVKTLPGLLAIMRERLEAETAHAEIAFPYFMERTAPVSGKKAFMDYECGFKARRDADSYDFALSVRVPVKSLCPCSKAISEYGAHNQRGIVEIEIRTVGEEIVWIEELVDYAEKSASSPVYPLLKRDDERHVTMHAFDNPAFVEDITRNAAVKLRADERISSFSIRVVNHESIHNHSAFATVEN